MKFWLVRMASIAAALAGVAALDLAAQGFKSFEQRLVVLAGIYVTLAVSLNLINGITGQFSIGHAAFYQVGAYTAGYLSKAFFDRQPLAAPVWIVAMIVAGAVAASLAGFVVGLPSLRLKGDYLAIVTLGFGEIIRIVTQNIPAIGGASGMGVQPKAQMIWLTWLLAVVCIAACRNMLRTAHGLPFLAVRDDEVASAAMGVNVTRTKVVAFVLGSGFAGAAGALLAHFEGFIIPTMFTMEVSFIILTMVVLGGTGSITGSILAGVLLFYLPELLRSLGLVPMPSLIASIVCVIAAVVALRKIGELFHGGRAAKAALILGTIAAAVLMVFLLRIPLALIPSVGQASVEGSKLRLVVFAATLIILMLLRPQGIFAHHEFSLDWLARVFGRKRSEVAA